MSIVPGAAAAQASPPSCAPDAPPAASVAPLSEEDKASTWARNRCTSARTCTERKGKKVGVAEETERLGACVDETLSLSA